MNDMVEIFHATGKRRLSALEANPDGGCFYLPHPVQVHSGRYWRCAHGQNGFWAKACWQCALLHPLLAWRWYRRRRSKQDERDSAGRGIKTVSGRNWRDSRPSTAGIKGDEHVD